MKMTSPALDGFARNLTASIPFAEMRVVDSEVGLEQEDPGPSIARGYF